MIEVGTTHPGHICETCKKLSLGLMTSMSYGGPQKSSSSDCDMESVAGFSGDPSQQRPQCYGVKLRLHRQGILFILSTAVPFLALNTNADSKAGLCESHLTVAERQVRLHPLLVTPGVACSRLLILPTAWPGSWPQPSRLHDGRARCGTTGTAPCWYAEHALCSESPPECVCLLIFL